MHMPWVVHEASEAGMGLQPAAARQIHGMRRDVVDCGAAVVAGERHLFAPLSFGSMRPQYHWFWRISSLVLDVPIRRRSQTDREHRHGRTEPFCEGSRTIIG